MNLPPGAITGQHAAPLEPSMVCMSVAEQGPRIAFAAYDEERNRILIEESHANGYETQGIVDRVLLHVRPTLLLVSNKIVSNEDLLEVLTTPPLDPEEGAQDEGARDSSTSDDQPARHSRTARHEQQRSRSIPYRLMKSSTFEPRGCKAMILKLRVRSLLSRDNNSRSTREGESARHFPLNTKAHSIRVSSYHSLASIIDFESKVQVQALGSLLSFLETTFFGLEDGGFITVNDVVQAKASAHMYVSSDTLAALSIFATEHHPLAAAKGYGNAKEGVSLFSLLDRTKSRAGRQRLREWMLKPLLDVNEIVSRQDGVELFMLPYMQQPASTLLGLLAQVGPVDKILGRMQKCSAMPNDFIVLIRTLSAAVAIIRTLQQDVLSDLQVRAQQIPQESRDGEEQDEALQDEVLSITCYSAFVQSILEECHVGCLEDLLDRITLVVDEEATGENRNVVVRKGYHECLDLYKEQYDNLGETLREAGKILSEYLPNLQSVLSTIFMPQVSENKLCRTVMSRQH